MTLSWTDPGCYSVSDGVHRVPLQMPQDGLKAINVYVLETHDGLALIDGGWRRDTTHSELAAALDRIARRPAEIHDIYVTHVHRDHYTFAVELRRRYGARVHLGQAEAPGISAINELGNSVPVSSLRELARAGAADIAVIAHRDALQDEFAPEDWEAPDSWLTPGPLAIPGHRIHAVHTPGHTKGHMVFHDLDREISYTGDHILPSITPSIGFELGEWNLPLARYLASLTLMLDDSDRLMMPSHGVPGGSVHERSRQLLAHHDRRLAATAAVIKGSGPSTGLDVAQALTWTRREKPFETLDNFNRMVATCETLAHLDVLVDRGVLTVRTHDGVDVFSWGAMRM
ncbi:MBL fold metallo-hydrolase [Rhodococcus fascians]|nr:MBL fold metallo-hydrolase [Rhodococcus fascians]MBY4237840.1 MBL fold metallo-hydrolase [Rhodococcus fascians]MBY4253409.1 MBL fold metallo-hydrolase [Rhodococcus fascians]MBY4269046.1 MBL fold metallo-hydrolase [Rhodococcus fascians]MBY4275099.1 MBL fold metallo-hydrolase [Rhodococcus fascians]